MSIRMEVWGENACFTRPEMKTERVTYDVMTPSAARERSTTECFTSLNPLSPAAQLL